MRSGAVLVTETGIGTIRFQLVRAGPHQAVPVSGPDQTRFNSLVPGGTSVRDMLYKAPGRTKQLKTCSYQAVLVSVPVSSPLN